MKKAFPLLLAASFSTAVAQAAPSTLFKLGAPSRTTTAISSKAPLRLDRASFGALRQVAPKQLVRFPIAAGETVTGQVFYARNDGAYRRVAGKLTGKLTGTFSLSIGAGEVAGLIDIPARKIVYKIETQGNSVILKPVDRSSVVCIPLVHNWKPTSNKSNDFTASAARVFPVLNSRPEARAQIYIDFDGATVNDPSWNGGDTIKAPASKFDDKSIKIIHGIVAEDYSAFNVNITTDAKRYNSAPAGLRMRCIVTPNQFHQAGGIAQIDSFSLSGRGFFSSTVPSWAYDYEGDARVASAVGETVSHEVGHTLGLLHDGLKLANSQNQEYFEGLGESPNSWGPIMGDPYNYLDPSTGQYGTNISQWSRGTYKGASNPFQDDLSIIASQKNGFGYAPDDVGNVPTRGQSLPISTSGAFKVKASINGVNDVDYFPFSTTGGAFEINLKGALYTDLNAEMQIEDAKGRVVYFSSPKDSFGAALSGSLKAGQYFLRVRGVGQGSGYTEGFTNYASFGRYTLSGNIAAAKQLRVATRIVTPLSSSHIQEIVPLEAKTLGDAQVSAVRFEVAPTLPTYTSAPAMPIDEFGDNYSSLTVNANGKIGKLLLNINISHPSPGTLRAFLIAPTGQYNIFLNPEAFVGSSLNRTFDLTRYFKNLPIKGDWSLLVEDNVVGDTGTLNSWSLTFEPQWQTVAVAKDAETIKGAQFWKAKWDTTDYAAGKYNLRATPICAPSALALSATNTDLQLVKVAPSVSLASQTVTENSDWVDEDDIPGTYVQLTLTLDRPYNELTSVHVRSLDSARGTTATAGVDYAPYEETVTFEPGQTSATVEMFIYADDVVEDPETVLLELSDPQNLKIANHKGDPAYNVVTILNGGEPAAAKSKAPSVSPSASGGRS